MTPTPSGGTVPPTPPIISTIPPASECANFDLQLSNTTQSVVVSRITGENEFRVEGNIEVCIEGLYYAICDEGWDDSDAQVACNTLGYQHGEYRKF